MTSLRSLAIALACLCLGNSALTAQAGLFSLPLSDADRCARLGPRLGAIFQIHQSAHFSLVSSAPESQTAAVGQMLDQVYDRFYRSFEQAGFSLKHDSGRLVCVCLDSHSQFTAYGHEADDMEVSWMDGYYSYQTNRVAFSRFDAGSPSQADGGAASPARKVAANGSPAEAISPGSCVNVRTATHEVSHQLAFNSGLQNRGVNYPFWVTEGLAVNFEATSADSCGLGQSESRYRSRLADARSRGAIVPLDQFVCMTDLHTTSSQATRDTYAQAWGLFAYLFEHHRQELIKYMADLSKAWPSPGPNALRGRFIAAFGPLDALDRDLKSSAH